MPSRSAVAIAALFLLSSCSDGPTAPSSPSSVNTPPAVSAPPAILVGAADIGRCGSAGPEQTARLLDGIDGVVFAAGDNAYPNGTAANYRDCYEPSWGRHKARTRPAPGNHEYDSGSPSAYFGYFGANAGPAEAGYYSYNLGAWHVVSLNSEMDTAAGGRQYQWLRADLASYRGACVVAYWHKPRFSSGSHGPTPHMQDLWATLHEFGVELLISGHDHTYERFAPMDASGAFAPDRGVRQFVVGTGGTAMETITRAQPNSDVRGSDWGVLKLTLLGGSYEWEFIPVSGGRFRDSGRATCN